MSGSKGVEITTRINKVLLGTRILILTVQADKFFAIEALEAGALGYLKKTTLWNWWMIFEW